MSTYCAQGLLGTARNFRLDFEAPILAGNCKRASAQERRQGALRAAALRNLISPVFLRREKKAVLPSSAWWHTGYNLKFVWDLLMNVGYEYYIGIMCLQCMYIERGL